MPRAYCSDCKELVEATPGRVRGASGQRDWTPLPHKRPDGTPCDSSKPAGDARFNVDYDVHPSVGGMPAKGFRWRT